MAPPSFYSDGRHERDPAERRQAAGLLAYRRMDPPGGWSDNRLLQSQKYSGVPYIAIQSILDLVGSCTYQIVRRKKNRPVKKALPTAHAQGSDEEYTPFDDLDHPLAKMVVRPNNQQTFGELCGDIVLQNRLTGVGPLWVLPNTGGKPVELWALKTALTYPLYAVSERYPRGAWRVTPYATGGWSGSLPGGLSNTGGVIPGEEVARFRDRHPLIDWDGFSPLTADAKQLDILEAIDESRWSAFSNGLQLDTVLVVPGADQGALDRLSAGMMDKVGGSRNARKFLALSAQLGATGNDKPMLSTFGQSPRDMDYQAGWDQMVKFCLAVFGVPSSVAGLQDQTSYAELYAALRQFHHRQGQYVRRMADWLTKTLCWPWCSFPDEFKVQIDLPGLDDPDLLENQLSADTGIRTVNERRALRNLDAVEGGDVPEQVYLKWVEQKTMPQQPQPGVGQMGELSDGQQGQSGDPLSSLLGSSPTGGSPPAPENDAGEGTLPPRPEVAKAMNTLSDPAGGFLVRPGVKRRKKKRVLDAIVKKALDSLGGE